MNPSPFPEDNRETNEPVENALSGSSALPQDNRGNNGPGENGLSGSSALPQDNRQNARPAQNYLSSSRVRKKIEDCLESYMTKDETAETLFNSNQIDRFLTKTVWELMEEVHPDFFKSYYLMVLLNDKVSSSTEWFKREIADMKEDIADLRAASEASYSIITEMKKDIADLRASSEGRQVVPAAVSAPDPASSVSVPDPESSVRGSHDK